MPVHYFPNTASINPNEHDRGLELGVWKSKNQKSPRLMQNDFFKKINKAGTHQIKDLLLVGNLQIL